MKIDYAPTQVEMFDEDNVLVQGWLQWFSGVGEALKGEWSSSPWKLTLSGASASPSQVTTVFRGKIMHCTIIWESGVVFTSATLVFPFGSQASIKFADGMLRVWDGTALSAGAEVSGGTISLPDLTTAGKVVLEGTLILQEV